MKTNATSLLRLAALAASLFVLPIIAAAHEAAPVDRAAQLLAATGSLPLQAAGPYVEAGTFRIQVSSKLGRPHTVLADGTWLYPNHVVANSGAQGTLVVRFTARGQVSQLMLVTPAVATAMAQPTKATDQALVAAR